MGRIYRPGRRFESRKWITIAAELMVIYVFYIVYLRLYPQASPLLLGILCAAAGALFAWGSWRLLGWAQKRCWYQTTPEGLSMQLLGKPRLYPWSSFRKATVDRFGLGRGLPVQFIMADGSRMGLEPYIEGVGSLTLDILEYLKGRAEIDPDLLERIETARAVQEKKTRSR